MAPLLASAVLSLVQGPYLPAADSEAPANAPVWTAGKTAEEHSFAVTASFDCPAGTVEGHLQVSISDTVVRATFGAAETTGRRVLALRVPARQLRGLKPALFCPESAATPGPVVRLSSRFTAQGALVCRSANGKRTADQASVAMDAWVRCPPLPDEETLEIGDSARDGERPAPDPKNEGLPPSARLTQSILQFGQGA